MRLGEDQIGVSGTQRADATGLRDIWALAARFGLANARPWRQSCPEEPLIRRMSAKTSADFGFGFGRHKGRKYLHEVPPLNRW